MNEQFEVVCGSKKTYSIFVRVAALLVAALLGSASVGFTAVNGGKASPVENINLTVTGCNVMVKTLSSNVIGSSSAQNGFRYEIDEAIHKLTATQNGSTMNIELHSTGKPNKSLTDMAVIFIPEQQYSKITVIGNDAGVSLPPLNAALNITSNNGAMSVRVAQNFSKTIDITSTGGSGSLVLSTLADNYTLNITGKNSAINVSPELPQYSFQHQYQYVKGNGKAAIRLNIVESSFAVTVEAIEDDKMDTITIQDKVYYLVNSENQLRLIGTKNYPFSANYMLQRDIDLKKPWIPIGSNDAAPFTGRFNGNGFTIKNIIIDDQKGSWKYLGFFGLVEGGTVHNVTLENVSIKTTRKTDVVIAPKGVVAAVVLNGEMTDCFVQ